MPALEAANAAVDGLEGKHIAEMKSQNKPHGDTHNVMQVVMVYLHHKRRAAAAAAKATAAAKVLEDLCDQTPAEARAAKADALRIVAEATGAADPAAAKAIRAANGAAYSV